MAEISDDEIQAVLDDESTPGPLRDAYKALHGQLAAERARSLDTERRATFAEAGLASHPARELLEKSFEAGMSADALRDMANKYGLLKQDASKDGQNAQLPHPVDGLVDEEYYGELEGLRRVNQAGSESPPGNGPTFDQEISRARSKEEWTAIMQRRGQEVGLGMPRTSKQGHRIV